MKNLHYLAFLLLCSAFSYAAPPLDLTDQTGELAKRSPVVKSLTEEEITFTEANERQIEETKRAEGIYPVAYAVIARSQPSRKGNEIQSLKKNELVKLLGQSKSGRWLAVELMRGKRVKAWLPRSAIKVDSKVAKPKSVQQD